ncbi:unnamed protein product [Nezara viridula]|uniref:Uncharacterized protein n=1 Tax=Nezara viridula TaxID=85310 RepID=A0A9P0EER7_NEZVI|nr:unnamed protein product [Nezara viridula]
MKAFHKNNRHPLVGTRPGRTPELRATPINHISTNTAGRGDGRKACGPDMAGGSSRQLGLTDCIRSPASSYCKWLPPGATANEGFSVNFYSNTVNLYR